MAYVRQMDMLMRDDAMPEILAQRFLAGHYERPGQEETRRKRVSKQVVGGAGRRA